MTALSTDCLQEIKHTCNVNALTAFSSWTDAEGQKNRYWDGNHTSSTEGCKCFSEKTCDSGFSASRNINYKCHCDSYLPDAVDYGILRSTSKLPVIQLHYGGSITPYSIINFQLGPLVCSGKKTFYPSEFALEERNSIKEEISTLQTEFTRVKIETEDILNSTLSQIQSDMTKFKEEIDALVNERVAVISNVNNFNMFNFKTVAFRAAGHNDGGGSIREITKIFSFLISILSKMDRILRLQSKF